MHNPMKFYFYGDLGLYNQLNPAFVLNQPVINKIIFEIARDKDISEEALLHNCDISEDEFKDAIEQLLIIKAVDYNNHHFKLNFSAFLEKDILFLTKYIADMGKVVGDKILSFSNEINQLIMKLSMYGKYPEERIRYHVICDQIFDGDAFYYFSQKNLFSIGKEQVDNRNYLIFAYEDCEVQRELNAKLLNSSNNYFVGSYVFNSFGDTDGYRRDIFRYFRLIERGLQAAIPFQSVNEQYLGILDLYHQKMLQRCGELIEEINVRPLKLADFKEEDQNYIKFLIEMDYIKMTDNILEISVPVFDQEDQLVAKVLSNLILDALNNTVAELFNQFEQDCKDLTFVKHGVDVKEVLNDLWHQIFAQTNDYLIERGYIASPPYQKEEGRYFKSFFTSLINNSYE